MDEVSGALVAIALVLCGVFVPTSFITGISGQFYRQFALTIVSATAKQKQCKERRKISGNICFYLSHNNFFVITKTN